jgi:hypothetical protein
MTSELGDHESAAPEVGAEWAEDGQRSDHAC